jgi:membrane dipeptidase
MKFVKQIGRIGKERIYELSPAQEKLAMDIHTNELVFDMHLHGVVTPEDIDKDNDEWIASMRYPLGYEGLRHAGIRAFIDGFGSMAHTWKMQDAIREIALRWCDIEKLYPDKVIRAIRANDVQRAVKEDKLAIFMCIENSELIGNEIENIDILYGLGVRVLGLAYNKRNLLADGRVERTDAGLSNFGMEAIKRMNELGIIVDGAHAGEKATIEACSVSKKPIMVSHTGARGVFNSLRMASDDELKALKDNGGLAGIHSGVNVLSNAKYQSVDDMVNHIEYIVNLIGINHVCIGSDNYFGDKNANHAHSIRKHASDGLQKYLTFNCDYMDCIENPSEWKNITRALVKRGVAREDIVKLIGGNCMRLVKEVIG